MSFRRVINVARSSGTKQMGEDCLISASNGYGFAQKAPGSTFTVGADDIPAALHESEHD